MATLKFDDYMKEQLNNDSFKKSFLEEKKKLDSALLLLKAREEVGYSQRELAELAQVPQSTIARIEKGANTSIDTLSKLAFALGKELKISFS